MKNLHATDFMEPDPVFAGPDMPLSELVPLFWAERVRALPVVEHGRLVGVVSETDLFLKEKGVPFSLETVTTLLGEPVAGDRLAGLERCDKVTVREVMTDHPVTITPETTLEDAAMLMHERSLSVLPVVEGDMLVGMARRINLLRAIYRTQSVAA